MDIQNSYAIRYSEKRCVCVDIYLCIYMHMPKFQDVVLTATSCRNNSYNSGRWACLVSLLPHEEKMKYQYGYTKLGNSWKSVFPNTRAWEQQE